MPSQLWQRLRAARKYADLTQGQVAEACGLSRSAVAQWEMNGAAHRTKPSVDHMMTVSRLTRAPLEWLMNDASSLEDLYQLAAVQESVAAPFPAANKNSSAMQNVRIGENLFAFATSVEEAAQKMTEMSKEPKAVKKHLILIGTTAQVHAVATTTDAMALIAAQISIS